jgi:hypothetical protein
MNKHEAMQSITQLWLDLASCDRNTLYFMQKFYPKLKRNHPELLTWRLVGGHRDREVMGILMQKKLVSIG